MRRSDAGLTQLCSTNSAPNKALELTARLHVSQVLHSLGMATARLDLMNLLAKLDHLYDECKRNQWLRYFAVACRVALALGFIPSGIVKVMGERFTGLPSNHPLGHYFDALYLTGFYYSLIGVGQLTAALLLLIPRKSGGSINTQRRRPDDENTGIGPCQIQDGGL